jgi:hypothetical protein
LRFYALAQPNLCPSMASVLFLVFGLLVTCPCDSMADQDPAGHTFLTSTNWSASAFSHYAGGTACWVTGEDGSLRVEVLRDSDKRPDVTPEISEEGDPDLTPLVTWSGDGWTMILGPDDEGTLNAWGREWRQVPVSLAQLVRLITASVMSYPVRPPEFSFARAIWPSGPGADISRPKILDSLPARPEVGEVWRFQLATLDLEATRKDELPSFRRNMTARGRGTGGQSEILELRWSRASGPGGFSLSIGSSRRPGALHLDRPRNQGMVSPEPEIFTPLWPLSQFFETR